MEEINRNHKDELFSYVFKEKDNFKALYEYLTKRKLDNNIELYNLDDNKNVLFNTKLFNDVAFKTDDNKLIIMVEHQSTNNPNMALRLGLYYFNSVYKYIKDNELNVFSKNTINVPKPEFYVVYNGLSKMKETNISLDNNFYSNNENSISINVKSYDINYINIDEMTKNDKTNIVNFYSYFIQQIREVNNINEAITNCKSEGFSFDYLENKEWIDMALQEYTIADRIKDESIEYGTELAEKMAEKMVSEKVKPLEDENAKLKAELEKYKEKEKSKPYEKSPILQGSKGTKSVELGR